MNCASIEFHSLVFDSTSFEHAHGDYNILHYHLDQELIDGSMEDVESGSH